MNTTQEYTQEEIEERAKENSDMYFETEENLSFDDRLGLENSFFWGNVVACTQARISYKSMI